MNPFISISMSAMSMAISATRLFFCQRQGIYSDKNPSFKLFILVVPLVLMIQAGLGCIWFFIVNISGPLAIVCFLGNVFLVAIMEVCFSLCLRKLKGSNEDWTKQSRKEKRLIIKFFSSWISPVSVWSNNHKLNFYQLLLTSVSTFVWPISFLIIFSAFFDFDPEYSYIRWNQFDVSWIILIAASMLSFISCLILQWIGNYHNLFKISKLLRFCSIQPFAHKSLFYDYLDNPEKFDKGNIVLYHCAFSFAEV